MDDLAGQEQGLRVTNKPEMTPANVKDTGKFLMAGGEQGFRVLPEKMQDLIKTAKMSEDFSFGLGEVLQAVPYNPTDTFQYARLVDKLKVFNSNELNKTPPEARGLLHYLADQITAHFGSDKRITEELVRWRQKFVPQNFPSEEQPQ